MFGSLQVDRDEMKLKDLKTYQSFYCGVCRDLKERCGEASRITLTYDMTFLAVLLTALYETKPELNEGRCLYHAGRKILTRRNAFTAYAADMNLLLVYHNLLDDWRDDRKRPSLALAKLLEPAYRNVARQYPEKRAAVRIYLRKLHRAERERVRDPELAAGLTGDLMREIFLYQKDFWERDLGRIGFYLGKYIYLKDAWEDREKDQKSGSYNPFLLEPGRERSAEEVLKPQAAAAAAAFERLPILEYADILRNILYAGIWMPQSSGSCRKIKKGSL